MAMLMSTIKAVGGVTIKDGAILTTIANNAALSNKMIRPMDAEPLSGKTSLTFTTTEQSMSKAQTLPGMNLFHKDLTQAFTPHTSKQKMEKLLLLRTNTLALRLIGNENKIYFDKKYI